MSNSIVAKYSTLANRIFNAWTSYATIVRNNEVWEMREFYDLHKLFQAGIDTKEKDEWFRESCVQYILNTPDLEDEDLEEWMADILNTEFDTIFEVRFDA